jgi:hypothetical protein
VTNLKKVERTISSHPLQEGDIIENSGDRRLILGVVGKAVFMSTDSTDYAASNGSYTATELERRGFKLVGDSEPTKEPLLILTIDEIAAKFGKRADQIRIKKGE